MIFAHLAVANLIIRTVRTGDQISVGDAFSIRQGRVGRVARVICPNAHTDRDPGGDVADARVRAPQLRARAVLRQVVAARRAVPSLANLREHALRRRQRLGRLQQIAVHIASRHDESGVRVVQLVRDPNRPGAVGGDDRVELDVRARVARMAVGRALVRVVRHVRRPKVVLGRPHPERPHQQARVRHVDQVVRAAGVIVTGTGVCDPIQMHAGHDV